jgi:hypothetical protein
MREAYMPKPPNIPTHQKTFIGGEGVYYMGRKHWGIIIITAVLLLQAACGLGSYGASTEDILAQNETNTAAVLTMADLGTRVSTARTPTPYGMSTFTPTPNIVYSPIAPSITPSQTFTRVAVPPNAPCNQAEYLTDLTIPDNSTITPRTSFIKTWRVRNIGSCTWDYRYMVVFTGRGNRLDAQDTGLLPESMKVRPGEVVDISIRMLAPRKLGNYESYWQLRSGEGYNFGTGTNGAQPFYTSIRVAEEFSFAEHLCSAQWSTGPNRPLPCPGKDGDAGGYVYQTRDPKLEDGQYRPGLGLMTAPIPAAGGLIIGKYPPIVVPKDTDFHSVVSCQPGASGCFVKFKLAYQIENGPEHVLGEWNEGLEGCINNAISDLDMLSGKQVSFILYVHVTGNPSNSRGVWFEPKISK